MKLLLKPPFFKVFLLALLIGFSVTACVNKDDTPPVPELTSPLAKKLVDSTCHFISKSDIAAYVERYQRLKKARDSASLPGTIRNVLTDSCSFNSNIVRKILTNEKCIGLRVLYGIGPDNRLHAILVGIAPDYSTLYIRRPKENCYPKQETRSLTVESPQGDSKSQNEEEGGAEMGQMP